MLVANALTAFDARALTPHLDRCAIDPRCGILMRPETIQFAAILAAFAVLGLHHFRAPKSV